MNSPHAALIVDTDPKGLEALVYGFQGAEWRMTACPSPETASLLLKASGAQIVVIASRSEHERTHTLIRQLRTKQASQTLPILVLGPEDLRPLLQEGGEIDLLPLPAFVRDVLTASRLLVTARAASTQIPGEEPCFRAAVTGALTLSLVRTMNGLCRSGQLHLERNGRVGEILFHQGETTAASIGALQAMAAVQHLMIWNDGKLELRLRTVPRRGQLHLSAPDFMLELDRFQRDYAHAMKAIGPAGTMYAANQDRLKQVGNAVPAEVTPVVRLCDGKRPLTDVIDESPFRVLDTVRILGRLAELGVLTHADGKPVHLAATAGSPAEDFLDTARIASEAQPWPMPAPVGDSAHSDAQMANLATDATTDTTASTASPVQNPGLESPAAPASASAPSAAEKPRPRKQTLEIGIPADAAAPARKTPTPVAEPKPVIVVQPAANVSTPVQAAAKLAPTSPETPNVVIVQPAPGGQAASKAAGRGADMGAAVVRAEQSSAAPHAKTLLHGSGAVAGSQASSASSSSADHPAPSAPSAQSKSSASTAQVGGVIEVRKAERRSQQNLRAVSEKPSVIVDSLSTESVTKPLPAAAPPSDNAQQATPSPPPDTAARPKTSARITGTLQVPPSRKIEAKVTATAQGSIHIDASLGSPLLSDSPTPLIARPQGPFISSSPTPPIAGAPSVARVTGEMHIVPSGKTSRGMAKPTPPSSSFHIDPSLTSQPAPATSPRPQGDGPQSPGQRRHPSGGFSALESDFFEREADLYKEEKPESFADLDSAAGKRDGKASGGQARKPGRPRRK